MEEARRVPGKEPYSDRIWNQPLFYRKDCIKALLTGFFLEEFEETDTAQCFAEIFLTSENAYFLEGFIFIQWSILSRLFIIWKLNIHDLYISICFSFHSS